MARLRRLQGPPRADGSLADKLWRLRVSQDARPGAGSTVCRAPRRDESPADRAARRRATGTSPDGLGEPLGLNDARPASLATSIGGSNNWVVAGQPHGLRQAAPRRRSPPRHRHPERLLPEPPRLPRVRRHRLLVRRRPRHHPLRPQPPRRLGRHARRWRLPGLLRRAVRPQAIRRGTSSRASGGRPSVRRETIQVRGERAGRRHGHRHAPRPDRRRRSGERATPWRSATRRSTEPNRTFDAFVADAPGRRRPTSSTRRSGRGSIRTTTSSSPTPAATIGYLTRGHVPVRAAANAWLPVPGWDGAHEWTGAISVRGDARACGTRPRA